MADKDQTPTGSADRPPTDEEEAAAERHDDIDESVAENYEDSMETGAKVKGEGEIVPED